MTSDVPLTADQENSLASLYNARLSNLGEQAQTVGWRSRKQQEARFVMLNQIGNMSGSTVLDVGCGFGDFYIFLLGNNANPTQYTGIDIANDLIKFAQKKFEKIPNVAFRHVSTDELSLFPDRAFDYVLASGIFNYPVADNNTYVQRTLEQMYRICRKGVAVNMTTDYVDFQDRSLFYFSPEDVFRFCKQLTKRVCLHHDYMPFEFTVFLYKDQENDADFVFVDWLAHLFPEGALLIRSGGS